jgi:alcohol dehydrogenase class IV
MFRIATNLYFGEKKSEKPRNIIKDLAYSKVATIIDKDIFNHSQVSNSLNSIKALELSLDVYKNESIDKIIETVCSVVKEVNQ